MVKGPPRRPLMDRLWEKVDVRGPDECWEWKASRLPGGYGRIGEGGKYGRIRPASRMVLEDALGRELRDDEEARHTCDNPPCCNPAHLVPGSRLDNAEDRLARGRGRHGERHGMARLTPEQVTAIRADPRPSTVLGPEYGVSPRHIRKIKAKVTWWSMNEAEH